MPEEKNSNDASNNNADDYETPVIEEVVTREGIEREVAYAGIVAPSQGPN